ncbi:MAG: hypothetical protein IJ008_03990 [Clostridia bacterium]|nr:hypothetical protein [Clostridia bacterium]
MSIVSDKKNKKINYFLTFLILLIILNMVIFPKKYINSCFNGISAWALNVLPSVLPFMFFTKLLFELNVIENFSKKYSNFTKKIYNTPPESFFVFLMSIISGYPVGAKMTADLYQSGKIKKSDAYKMTSFCSTSGPMFIIGAVGIGMISNVMCGYIIFLSHILGAIFNGFLYRKIKIKNDCFIKNNHQNISIKQTIDISEIVINSSLSIISVGTIIAIFFIIIEFFSSFFAFLPQKIGIFLVGLIEITKGCIDISTNFSLTFATVFCSFIISFGGISTILQSLTMLSKLDMPISLFILQKFTHALFALIFALIFVFFIF